MQRPKEIPIFVLGHMMKERSSVKQMKQDVVDWIAENREKFHDVCGFILARKGLTVKDYMDFIVQDHSPVDKVSLYIMSRLSGIRISVLLHDGSVWGVNKLQTFEEISNNSGFIFAYLGNSELVLTRQLERMEYDQRICEHELKASNSKKKASNGQHGMFESYVSVARYDLNQSSGRYG